jgi:hypothetical protein
VTSLTIALTGQALLHGPLDLCGPGDRVRELIGEADLATVNLEATVATEGAWPTKTKTLHPANPDGIASLRAGLSRPHEATKAARVFGTADLSDEERPKVVRID